MTEIKCTTVEGHQIKVGEFYETRNGKKAFVFYISSPLRSDGTSAGIHFVLEGCLSPWYCDERGNFTLVEHSYDLMRPWVEKKGSEKPCKNPDCFYCIERSVLTEQEIKDGYVLHDGEKMPDLITEWIEVKKKYGGKQTGFAWQFADNWQKHRCKDQPDQVIIAYRIIDEPACFCFNEPLPQGMYCPTHKPPKKVYKLSEMWKVYETMDKTSGVFCSALEFYEGEVG